MTVLAKTSSGLLFSDDFNRADNGTIGNGWVEDSGTWDISSNRLRGPSDVSVTTVREVSKDLGVVLSKVFLQATFDSRNSADSSSSLIHRGGLEVYGPSGANGYRSYFNKLQNTLDIFKVTSGSNFTTSATQDTSPGRVSAPQEIQFYVANAVQQARTGASADGQVNGTDSTHAFPTTGVNTRIGVWATHPASGNSAARPVFDDLMVFSDKLVTITGMPLGYKAKIVNSLAGTVVQGTAASSTLTLDTIRGSASEYVPFAGWAAIQILDPSDTIVATYSTTGIYPGDVFAFDLGPVEGDWEWTITEGDLPPGLTLDSATGFITGTPTTPGTYEFSYTVSNGVFTSVEESCQITIQGEYFEIEPEKPDTTWLFNLGRFHAERELIWHKHTRTMYCPAVVNSRDMLFVGTATDLDSPDVEDTVLRFDRLTSVSDSAYWTSPTLNQKEFSGHELTVYRLIVYYEAGGSGFLDIKASPNGGLEWQRNTGGTAFVNNTNGKIGRTVQGLHVTGLDVRLKISFPNDKLIRIHRVIAEVLVRGRL